MSSRSPNKEWFDRARDRMKELGITQAQLAEAIEALPSRVNHYLTGRNDPTLAHFAAISRCLGVTSDWLLFGGAASPLGVPSRASKLAEKIERLDDESRRDIEGFIRVRIPRSRGA